METLYALAMGRLHMNDQLMVFDWDKAAHILAVRNPDEALAGLQYDYEYTAGVIWRKGKPVKDEYTYLASTWARPMLIIGDEEIECWRYKGEVPEWNSETKWPQSALEIVKQELNNRTYAIVLPPVDADDVPISIGDVLEFKLANEEEQ